jgi:two-component system, sensor histidine kinase
MPKLDLERLVTALAEAGVAVAVVERDGKLALSNAPAQRLGDARALAKLAEEAAARPEEGLELEQGEIGPWRLRAVARGDQTILVGHAEPELTEARRALHSSDDFLSFASHLIDARVSRGDQVERSTVDQIRRQVARLTRLINQLLDVTRVKQRRIELAVEPCDLSAIVRSAVDHLDPGRASDLTVRGVDRAVLVQADRTRAAEVAGELLENAARFTPPGTAITVELTADERSATVTVADAGPGIPEAERATLFDAVPHARSPARKSATQGLGLGLHIARALARLHGGELSYQPGTPGSIFRATFPR